MIQHGIERMALPLFVAHLWQLTRHRQANQPSFEYGDGGASRTVLQNMRHMSERKRVARRAQSAE